ncbi:MAG: cob(I)yrinic acid a,c-diamide adenosyltransferase [Gammaproteobacteria bacterium]|nr:cob(I)yrinic acid a,c-diamide adenosyltransferase [Gammaproteobacteria bacterium]
MSAKRRQDSDPDPGSTQLFGSRDARKTDARVDVLGNVDELVSALGLARSNVDDRSTDKILRLIQSRLLAIGAAVAEPDLRQIVGVAVQDVDVLEQATDALVVSLPKLTYFILPGGNPGATALHLARSVCRRAERSAHVLSVIEEVPKPILGFLNRLSTYLFHLARWQSIEAGDSDDVWRPSEPLTGEDLDLEGP